MATTPAKKSNAAATKATTAKPASKKLAEKDVAPLTPVLVAADADISAEPKVASGLRLKELVDVVVAATGGKKKGVKEIVEATLTAMGNALQRGETLNLPTFGRVRVARQSETATGALMTLKMRRNNGDAGKAKAEKQGLAEANDQG